MGIGAGLVGGQIDAFIVARGNGTDFAIDERPELRYRAGNWLLDCLERLGVKNADVERICSGNARELLRLKEMRYELIYWLLMMRKY